MVPWTISLLVAATLLSPVQGDCVSEFTSFSSCINANPSCQSACSLGTSSVASCEKAKADFCKDLDCCPACKQVTNAYFICLANLYGSSSNTCSLPDCSQGSSSGQNQNCVPRLADLNADTGLAASSSNMEATTLDLDFCRTVGEDSQGFLILDCIFNPDTLGRSQEELAYQEACTQAGGVAAQQEFLMACQGDGTITAKFVRMPVCSFVGCSGQTPLVSYTAGYENYIESVLDGSCSVTIQKTIVPGEDETEQSSSSGMVVSRSFPVLTIIAFVVMGQI